GTLPRLAAAAPAPAAAEESVLLWLDAVRALLAAAPASAAGGAALLPALADALALPDASSALAALGAAAHAGLRAACLQMLGARLGGPQRAAALALYCE